MSLPQRLQGKKEFRSTAFKFSPGTLRSLSINGLGAGIRARRTYKEKVASKPCGKKTQGIKTVDLSNCVFLCPHNVSKYCHRVPGMTQRRTLENGVLSWASSKLLANWLWKDLTTFYKNFYNYSSWSCNYWVNHASCSLPGRYKLNILDLELLQTRVLWGMVYQKKLSETTLA